MRRKKLTIPQNKATETINRFPINTILGLEKEAVHSPSKAQHGVQIPKRATSRTLDFLLNNRSHRPIQYTKKINKTKKSLNDRTAAEKGKTNKSISTCLQLGTRKPYNLHSKLLKMTPTSKRFDIYDQLKCM